MTPRPLKVLIYPYQYFYLQKLNINLNTAATQQICSTLEKMTTDTKNQALRNKNAGFCVGPGYLFLLDTLQLNKVTSQ